MALAAFFTEKKPLSALTVADGISTRSAARPPRTNREADEALSVARLCHTLNRRSAGFLADGEHAMPTYPKVKPRRIRAEERLSR